MVRTTQLGSVYALSQRSNDSGVSEANSRPPCVGSITITFYDTGGHVVPQVSFAPLGRINPNTIEQHLPFIYRAIQREQVTDRRRAAARPLERSDNE
jgi:hypothetical protein